MTSMAFPFDEVVKGTFQKCYNPSDIWNVTKNNKIHKIKLSDVKHWVYTTPWSHKDNNHERFLSIYEVLILPKKYNSRMQRIEKSDLSYPIIIQKDKFDKNGGILDGNHRFAKAIMSNKKYIYVKYISNTQLKKIELSC